MEKILCCLTVPTVWYLRNLRDLAGRWKRKVMTAIGIRAMSSIENLMTLSSAVANLETKPLRRVGDEDLSLRAGDVVEERSKAEILSTLDQDGRLENPSFHVEPVWSKGC